jgi:glycerophosphoryl diester phosphodiesterase
MYYIAHRGCTINYYDNSLGAFLEAIKYGFDMLELDIQLCKTKEIVVFHDISIDNRYIKDMTYDELKKYNVITLSDFYTKIDTNKINIYLDLKGDIDLIDILVRFFIKNKINTSNIYLGSFNFKHLNLLQFYKDHLENFEYKLGIIIDNIYDNVYYQTLFGNVDFICINWTMLDDDLISWCKQHNKKVFTYTCKSMNNYELISDFNVDGIVTDILLPPLNL